MRIFANANYNFIKWRWHALILSVTLIWAGVATIFLKGGVPLGIEFKGGTAIVLRFDHPVGEDAVRHAIDPVSREAVVQQYGNPSQNEVVVRLPMMAGEEQGTALEEGAQKVNQALRAANIGAFQIRDSQIIGPQMGKDYQSKGVWATVAALGGILIYVALRFRFTFAVGAIVAAFHDILITLVFLTWFGYDLTLNIIAGILTITGYSVNDTIVVFDRVRENQRQMRREPLDQIVNKSVNQTLGRTIITSGVTFLAVLSLYVFGGEVLRGFAFTMLIGVVTGTYSTVFIAAAIAIILSRRPAAGNQIQSQTQPRPRRAPAPKVRNA
jgi:preprotein translocase subunit SecF